MTAFSTYCSLHHRRAKRWGSPTVRPQWTGSTRQREQRIAEIVTLLEAELARGNPIVRHAVAQVKRWGDDARAEYDAHGFDGVRYLPSRRRSWARLWFRLSFRPPLRVLAAVLLIADGVDFDGNRPDARACAVIALLSKATRGPRPVSTRADGRGPIVALSATAATGRRVLRAMAPLIDLYTLYVTEQRLGRQSPRRPRFAFTRPKLKPRWRRRWSHLERRWLPAA